MAQYPVKVHLMGGDGRGWALDQDLATTRGALESMPDLIRFAPLAECDVVHSVWEYPLLHVEPWKLEGRRVICHVCNDVERTFEQPVMLRAIRSIGLWVPISRLALDVLRSLKLRCEYVPYVIDRTVFKDKAGAAELRALREQWGIPEDRYVVGNFMRDSLGADLTRPKDQKGADLFVEILSRLHRRNLPVHVLLAGPRRHWIRARLAEHGVPFSYVGRAVEGDDNDINILSQPEVARLYHLIDVNLVTSRWEGGPRAVLEAAASRTKAVSTPVGLSPDVLEPACIYRSVDEAVRLLEADIRSGTLDGTVPVQFDRVARDFVPEANLPRFRSIYERVDGIPPVAAAGTKARAGGEPLVTGKAFFFLDLARRAAGRMRRAAAAGRRGRGPCIGIWHEFHKPPYGGGNQFMMALQQELERLGATVMTNRMSPGVDVHLCNSAWFDFRRFDAAAQRQKLRVIQRVDGPIAVYRGSDWEHDNRIYDLNARFASATVYQSGWCFRKMLELGFRPVNPVIIRNAVDGGIFHRKDRAPFSRERRIRLISSAWSDNPKKGGPFYKALEGKLDWNRFEYTFVGRTKEKFEKIRHVPAQDSHGVAALLRQHDIYIMASQSESCSNAVIEALSCGLPVLYIDDAGTRELVGFGGLPFLSEAEALANLERLVDMYESFQAVIDVPTIRVVAERYLDLARRVMDAG